MLTPTTPTVDGIDENNLSEGERNVLLVLRNLPTDKFNALKERFGLSHPSYIGPMTLDVFVQFAKSKNIDISTEGISAFKRANGLTDTGDFEGRIGPTTAMAYYEQLSKKESNLNQELVNVAAAYVGVREQRHNRGSEVEKFQKAVDGQAVGEPWCMSFVQYCIKVVEENCQVNSEVFKSEHCITVWNRSSQNLRLSAPEVGCLVIWQKGQTTSGHVGIVERVKSQSSFTTIEGNTGGSSTGNQREGEGVHRKPRDMNGWGSTRIIGFLKAF
ncbi:MAG: CHAP domain-containing protein [Leptolyngbyaceae cyanobacterium RM2_2_4]|nr:CHAP domain-containing protein [Leptolyngbyaceae cyanobacterium SM1_4_3]NJN89740.1 CHAP domain-containing protein [Leptolyngbyaceae cyanobacterium SL_5_14]NJO50132.1 CHAP domain-containing protein [Leptolyngbyaceae cyanobacterium RM2_2_4]